MIEERSGVARLERAFAAGARDGRALLIPYICGGDPDLATSSAVLEALGPAGADIVELGVPYGDPLADGPTVAAAAQRALHAGASVERVIGLVRAASKRDAPPTLLFTYFNPVVQFGLERFATALRDAGACGAIVPDLPFEESGPVRDALRNAGLALPLLVAPTTPFERAVTIANASDGFVYLVSRLGVTGARREPDFAWIAERVAALRSRTRTPVAVGFGIATPDHVRRVAQQADAAVVGSALVDAYAGTSGADAVARASAFVSSLVASLSR